MQNKITEKFKEIEKTHKIRRFGLTTNKTSGVRCFNSIDKLLENAATVKEGDIVVIATPGPVIKRVLKIKGGFICD